MNWTSISLNRNSPVPLYYQLVEHIRDSVRSGHLAADTQLPAERYLADQTGISRMTVRQALAFLERDGTLVVRPGIGTFVAAPKLTYDALHLVGFTEETMRQGGAVSSRVTELDVSIPPSPVAAALRLSATASAIKIVRLRASGDDPLLLETSYLPADCCAGLEREDLGTHSLYMLLETRYGLPLVRASQTVEATTANELEADLFHIALHAPVLLVEGVTYTTNDQPIECFKAVYRADRVSLAMESRRAETSSAGAASSWISVVVTS